MAKQAQIYCTIGYERHKPKGCGYVARFFRKSDDVQVGAANWDRKGRTFFNARGIGGKILDMAQVNEIAPFVPELRIDSGKWYSNEKVES